MLSASHQTKAPTWMRRNQRAEQWVPWRVCGRWPRRSPPGGVAAGLRLWAAHGLGAQPRWEGGGWTEGRAHTPERSQAHMWPNGDNQLPRRDPSSSRPNSELRRVCWAPDPPPPWHCLPLCIRATLKGREKTAIHFYYSCLPYRSLLCTTP